MRRRHGGDAVGLRQEPSARHRVDATTVVEVAERERDVAHGQARTEQQHVFPAVQLERVGRPRIAGVPKARVDLVSLDPRVGRREVADRKHDPVDVQHPPVRERQPAAPVASAIATTSPATRTSGRSHARRASSSRAARYSPYERRGTKEPPVSDGSLARTKRRKSSGSSSNALIRPAGTFNVWLPEAVEYGDAADLPLDSLDEQDAPDGRRRRAQKVDRDGRPAEPGPDDRDRAFALTHARLAGRGGELRRRTRRDDAAKLVVAELVPGDRGEKRLAGERPEDEGSVAVTVAVRGTSRMSASSPKTSSGPSSRRNSPSRLTDARPCSIT